MSLLSTFSILFQTDAEQAKKDIDEVDQSLSNTESTANDTADSFDDLGGAVDGSSDSFVELSEGLGVAAAGLVTVIGLFAGITSQAMGTDEIGKFSETMGLSIEEVGAWGEAVKRSGGSAEGFRGSLEGLTGQLTDISLTGGGEASEVFARLGINAMTAGGQVKSAFDVLPELASSFQGLSRAEAVGFGQKLGLDQGTILLLQQGRVAVEDLVTRQKELGVATQEDYEAAAQFNDALNDTTQILSDVATKSGTTILPLLTKLLKGFDSIVMWMRDNEDLVTGFFIGAAAAITVYYLPAIISAATATVVAISPFIAIGAAIAAVGVAVALLYEDVKAYLGGQSSFIGDLAAEYEWFGKIVDAVISGVKFVIAELSEFTSEMFANMQVAASFLVAAWDHLFGGASDEFSEFGDSMTSVVDVIIKAFSMLGDAISFALGFIASPIETTKELIDDLFSLMDNIPDLEFPDLGLPDFTGALDGATSGIKSFFGFGDDEVDANINKAIELTGEVDNNQLNGQTSASIVNSQASSSRVNNIQTGNTTVNAQSADAQEVARLVSDNKNNDIAMAIQQLDDGVMI